MSKKTFPETLPSSHRIEFLTVKLLVQEMMEKGHTKKNIWKALTDSGSIAMSYSQFTRYTSQPRHEKVKPNPRTEEPSQNGVAKRKPIIAFQEDEKITQMSISTIGKEYLLEPARR